MGVSSAKLSSAGYYLHWGVVQISLTNLLIIAGMIVLFIAALVIPFPRPRADEDPTPEVEEHRDVDI